ncbi:hypothetical protein CB1_000164015 [Camelus ferus]|nr:hypothetical protein CB1_000164015 [Camelus ferus]
MDATWQPYADQVQVRLPPDGAEQDAEFRDPRWERCPELLALVQRTEHAFCCPKFPEPPDRTLPGAGFPGPALPALKFQIATCCCPEAVWLRAPRKARG